MPRDAPGMVVPPPLIYLPAVVLGWLSSNLWSLPAIPPLIRYVLGSFMMLASLALVLWVLREFSRASTHFDARKSVTTLVTSGPFRFSRNPAYLSLSLLCAGIAVVSDRLWIALWLVPAMLAVNVLIIRREERFLEGKFGDAYLKYKARVRRWM